MAQVKFPVIVTTLVPHGWFERTMEALVGQRPIEADIVLVQQSAAVADQCMRWADRATVLAYGRNVGLAGAWNRALPWAWERGYAAALLLNDDLVLTDPRTLTILRDIVLLAPRQLRYLHDRGYSAICLTRAVWDEVGPFDEGFAPAFFEDNDHHWRCKVLGIPWDEVLVDTEHWGSGTLKADGDFSGLNAVAFSKNAERYQAKWGGGPHHEAWTIPWGGGAPWPSTLELIPASVRAAIERPFGIPEAVPT